MTSAFFDRCLVLRAFSRPERPENPMTVLHGLSGGTILLRSTNRWPERIPEEGSRSRERCPISGLGVAILYSSLRETTVSRKEEVSRGIPSQPVQWKVFCCGHTRYWHSNTQQHILVELATKSLQFLASFIYFSTGGWSPSWSWSSSQFKFWWRGIVRNDVRRLLVLELLK